MKLTSLLIAVHEDEAQVLKQVLGELHIGVETCPDLYRAGVRLEQERFDVVIVDSESQKETLDLLRNTRVSRLNDATLAVTIVSSQEPIREMFSLGVNFVLYKPVSYERALSSLRAARAVMRKEKRRSGRAAVHTHATVDYANVAQEKATLVDLAENGMAVLFGKRIPPTSKVYFQFRLPGQASSIRLSGQVMWQDWNGRAGVQFVDVPKTSRRMLDDYLSENLPRNAESADSFDGVTVEMEEPIAAAPAATASKTENELERFASAAAMASASRRPVATVNDRREAIKINEIKINPVNVEAENNRRGQKRYSCRLGAQVYQTGVNVPNHCCLTDLSEGGCYLEVPLPFAKNASVEIVVRTNDMKLHLRGKVQASHPGYGMGISFDLGGNDAREQVKKLTDFVERTSPPSE